jgi:hypothetical protein
MISLWIHIGAPISMVFYCRARSLAAAAAASSKSPLKVAEGLRRPFIEKIMKTASCTRSALEQRRIITVVVGPDTGHLRKHASGASTVTSSAFCTRTHW